jgi:hypothetical protein
MRFLFSTVSIHTNAFPKDLLLSDIMALSCILGIKQLQELPFMRLMDRLCYLCVCTHHLKRITCEHTLLILLYFLGLSLYCTSKRSLMTVAQMLHPAYNNIYIYENVDNGIIIGSAVRHVILKFNPINSEPNTQVACSEQGDWIGGVLRQCVVTASDWITYG